MNRIFLALFLAIVCAFADSNCLPTSCLASGAACPSQAVCDKCLSNFTIDTPWSCESFANLYNCLKPHTQCAESGGNTYLSLCPSFTTNCTACNQTLPTPTTHLRCPFNEFCDKVTGMCTPTKISGSCNSTVVNYGAECGKTTQGSVFRYQCDQGQCTPEPALFAGDKCTLPAECYSNDCKAGVCVGKALGASCTRSDCAFGLSCANNKCAPFKKIGENCTAGECVPDELTTCGLNGKCTQFGSIKEGHACSIYGIFDCEFGTFCLGGNCTKYPAKLATCTDSTSCQDTYGPYSSCQCEDDGTQKCAILASPVKKDCSAEITAVHECLQTNKCVGMIGNPGSCSQTNCVKQLDCLQSCLPGDLFGKLDCGEVPETYTCASVNTAGTNVAGKTDTNQGYKVAFASFALMFAAVLV